MNGEQTNEAHYLIYHITHACCIASASGMGELCPQDCCQPRWCVEAYGEYLYWKVSEDQLQYAATMDFSSSISVDPGTLLFFIFSVT